jgi:hypothetical protein
MVPATILDYVMYGNCIGRFVRQLTPDPVSLCFSLFQYICARKLHKASRRGIFNGPRHYFGLMYGNCIGRFIRQLASDAVSLCFSSFQYLFAHKLNKASGRGIFNGPRHYFGLMYGNCIGRFVRQLAPDPVSLCFSSFQYLFAHKLNKASRRGIFNGPHHYFGLRNVRELYRTVCSPIGARPRFTLFLFISIPFCQKTEYKASRRGIFNGPRHFFGLMYGNFVGRFVRQWAPDPVSLCFSSFQYLFAHRLNKASRRGIFNGPRHYFRLMYGNCIGRFVRQLAPDPVSLCFSSLQ